MTWTPRTWASEQGGNVELVRCPSCRRMVLSDNLIARTEDEYICGDCLAVRFASGAEKREDVFRAIGAPDEVIAHARGLDIAQQARGGRVVEHGKRQKGDRT